MLLLSLHTYTYMNLHEWGVLGQRLSIDTSYVDDLGEIFERFCNAAQFLWEVCCLSLSQKDGEPEGHDLNRQMYRMIQWYWYRHMANFLDQACRQQLAVSRGNRSEPKCDVYICTSRWACRQSLYQDERCWASPSYPAYPPSGKKSTGLRPWPKFKMFCV